MDYFSEQWKNYQYTLMVEAIKRIRELHKAFEETNENGYVNIVCSGCYEEDSGTGERFHDRYPCPTIKALDNN